MKKLSEQDIRLFFDENMPVDVAERLNELGINTVTARDLERLGHSDPNQLEFATADRRVLCTYDKDYIRIASRGIKHAGIVFIPGVYRDYGVLLRYFIEFKRIYSPSDMENRLEYLYPTLAD
ncbi:MAG: DUF5615 family PIN-like protein [Chloroflexota bacterium]|nr:DUF5615 family PIN-like protein [Chloroflexota bacterium]MDE2857790.1 DUF5615 family PIN-like protein [Chloroflexota bacterium]MDE2952591.1 DUF5615 family PIN-like protein [Chloroflexota bacterium]